MKFPLDNDSLPKHLKSAPKSDIIGKTRANIEDIWNAFMLEDADFSLSCNGITTCHTTATSPPNDIIDWCTALEVYHARIRIDPDFIVDKYICWYIDDQLFDHKVYFTDKIKKIDIWLEPERALNIIKHFAGIITPDFSTYNDMVYPIKLYNTYRMRTFGRWIGEVCGIPVINNVRWGTPETYSYCWDGIPRNSMVCIGTVGGNPYKIEDRPRFILGFLEMIKVLKPHTILTVGSANYPCFEYAKKMGIQVIPYDSDTDRAFKRGRSE